MKFRTKMVISVSTVLILYAIVVLFFSWYGKIVPDSLTAGVFAVGVGEYGILGWIKVSDDKNSNVNIYEEPEEVVIHGFNSSEGHI